LENSPINSFFLVSIEIAGCPAAIAALDAIVDVPKLGGAVGCSARLVAALAQPASKLTHALGGPQQHLHRIPTAVLRVNFIAICVHFVGAFNLRLAVPG